MAAVAPTLVRVADDDRGTGAKLRSPVHVLSRVNRAIVGHVKQIARGRSGAVERLDRGDSVLSRTDGLADVKVGDGRLGVVVRKQEETTASVL